MYEIQSEFNKAVITWTNKITPPSAHTDFNIVQLPNQVKFLDPFNEHKGGAYYKI